MDTVMMDDKIRGNDALRLHETLRLAVLAHENQSRKDGLTPYVVHPIEVMKRLVRWGISDLTTLQIALLHDVLEENPQITFDALSVDRAAGPDVAEGVRLLSFRPKAPDESASDYQAAKAAHLGGLESAPAMVIVVKVADRLCNVEDFAASATDWRYAPKYLERGRPIFQALKANFQKVRAVYGGEVYRALCHDAGMTSQRIRALLLSKD